MTRTFLLLTLGACFLGAQPKPDFSGTWKLDTAASEFGPGAKPRACTEVIRHHDPALTIDRTFVSDEGEVRTTVKYSTDGSEVESVMGDQTITSKTTWEGSRLRTIVKSEDGPPMSEVREIDSKNRMLVRMDYRNTDKSGTVLLIFAKK